MPYIDMNQPWIYMCSPSRCPPPTSLPPWSLWVFPVHQPWALVSCTQSGLAICFTLDNIHVSMLLSQIIPSSPSPIESKSLFHCALVQLLSRVRLFETPWITECQASLACLSSTPRVYSKLMSIELVILSSHLIFCRPLLLLPVLVRKFSFLME